MDFGSLQPDQDFVAIALQSEHNQVTPRALPDSGRDDGTMSGCCPSMVTPANAHILVIEDEEAIRELVAFHLHLGGFRFTGLSDGAEALQQIRERSFDLIILDVVLPTVDGLTLCQAIRKDGPNFDVPVLMLTARAEESDRVVGLDTGADDYLTKPFSVRELMSRIRALLRRPKSTWRSPSNERDLTISRLGVTIDPGRRRVTVDGQPVSLTPQEFGLLHLLASNPGIVFEREELLARVWRDEVFVTVRGVDTLVSRLRRKIERNPTEPTRVVTARGAGYKFGEE
jgi:DNA-binding response OmpR family regulator